jgi:hypothetical protein
MYSSGSQARSRSVRRVVDMMRSAFPGDFSDFFAARDGRTTFSTVGATSTVSTAITTATQPTSSVRLPRLPPYQAAASSARPAKIEKMPAPRTRPLTREIARKK